jgi:hypothetical protein
LLVVQGGPDVAKEEHDFQRLDIRAGSDHVHGDRDAELGRGAELGDEVLCGLLAAGAVGDLLAEVVTFAEYIARDVNNTIGVGVVFGVDEGLGNPLAASVRKPQTSDLPD